MSGTATSCTITPRTFGPRAATPLELKGIRFMVPPNDDGAGGGSEYTPPADQAALDKIITERLGRALKPYEGFKDLDLTDVLSRYIAVKDVDIDALKGSAAELATFKATQGASESELNRQLTEATTRATTAEAKTTTDATTISELQAKLLRYEVAADNQLPLTHAPRLVGTTKEELDADAKEYRKSLRTGGFDPGQGQGSGGAQAGADGTAEADRRFGKSTT